MQFSLYFKKTVSIWKRHVTQIYDYIQYKSNQGYWHLTSFNPPSINRKKGSNMMYPIPPVTWWELLDYSTASQFRVCSQQTQDSG